MRNDPNTLEQLYTFVTGDEDARVCRDIPENACADQPHNFFAYLTANCIGKIADELASAKLILPWLLASVGAPTMFAGFIVPIREAGVLLPQLLVAAAIRKLPKRKGVWILGAALSSLALIIMAFSAASVSGTAAGWAIIGALILFSVSRGLCSVSAKDVLGKTISKTKRGTLMGYSSAIAGVATLAIGAYLQWFSGQDANTSTLVVLLLSAAGLWFIAIAAFATIREQPGATDGGGNALTVALGSFSLIKTDRAFRDYLIARALLLSVALTPPFYVLLAQQHSAGGLSSLGMLFIAVGIADSISAPIWGRLGDKSSRTVMGIAAAGAAVIGVLLFLLSFVHSPLLNLPIIHALFYLALTVFHSGVRLGRKVYLVDLANADNRATYVALSNTIIGTVMLAAGVVGVFAELFHIHFVILLLSLIAASAATWCSRLPEVIDP